MTIEELNKRNVLGELKFSSSRSSGPGGQNVNKVNTRIELRFNIPESQCLSEKEKETLMIFLKNKISGSGELIIVSQSERTQLANKEAAKTKFFSLVTKILTPAKKRRPTSPTKASKEKRLENKRITSERKSVRRRTEL